MDLEQDKQGSTVACEVAGCLVPPSNFLSLSLLPSQSPACVWENGSMKLGQLLAKMFPWRTVRLAPQTSGNSPSSWVSGRGSAAVPGDVPSEGSFGGWSRGGRRGEGPGPRSPGGSRRDFQTPGWVPLCPVGSKLALLGRLAFSRRLLTMPRFRFSAFCCCWIALKAVVLAFLIWGTFKYLYRGFSKLPNSFGMQ